MFTGANNESEAVAPATAAHFCCCCSIKIHGGTSNVRAMRKNANNIIINQPNMYNTYNVCKHRTSTNKIIRTSHTHTNTNTLFNLLLFKDGCAFITSLTLVHLFHLEKSGIKIH